MMERSLLYRLHGNGIKPGVKADETKWKEVHRSKYGRVRVYKILNVDEESKKWVPENRICDVEGGWFCRGQYPPGLSEILEKKKDFAQLEDFNRGEADEEYQKQYFEALNNPEKAKRKARRLEAERMAQMGEDGQNVDDAPKDETQQRKAVDEIYNTWEDTEATTLMWNLISSNQVEELRTWLEEEPSVAFVRSRDGRGPMWYV